MVAFSGPSSITCGQMSAMKRPSEVPPLVESSVVDTLHLLDGGADRIHQIAARREVGLAGEFPFQIVFQPVLVENGVDLLFQAIHRAGGGEAEIEQDLDRAGHHIGGTGAAVDVGDLPGSRREIFVAVVPCGGGQFGNGGRGQMDGVLHQMRIGDVALHAFDRERAGQRAAPAVLDGVAGFGDGGRLADDAVIQFLVAFLQGFHHAHRAVDRHTFFIRGEQQGDGAAMLRVFGDELLDGGDEGGERTFHVGRAASVQHAVAHRGREWVAVPFVHRAGRYHVGVPGEADHRRSMAAPCPQIVHLAVAHLFQAEIERGQARADDVDAAVIHRGERMAGDELFGEVESVAHFVVFKDPGFRNRFR